MEEEKKMEKTKKMLTIITAVEAVVAIFMWFAVTKLAPVCSGMLELVSGKQVHMKCYYASVVFVFIAVVLLINAVLAFFVKPNIVTGIMTVIVAALTFATLNDAIGIGICMNPDMACQMTAPFVKVCATVEIICGLAYTFVAAKAGK